MQEIVRVGLDNEMDLILAHKRTMKLSELCGLSVSSQTTFATAVSEIARCAIGHGNKSQLVLSINALHPNKKTITASIFDTVELQKKNPEAFAYAKRLMGQLEVLTKDGIYEVKLHQRISFGGIITPAKINLFKDYFKHEPPLSPYDEIRKKNIQLIELAEKLKESETQYRVLTDTLPLMIFAVNYKGEVSYTNKWLRDFIGNAFNTVAGNQGWQNIAHPDDVRQLRVEWEKSFITKTIFHSQARLKQKDKETYIWHMISVVPVVNEKDSVGNWIGFFVDIHAHKLIEETLKDNKALKEAQSSLKVYQAELEAKIKELNISNHDLEQFAYIASHDLQEPLRKIKTFSLMLEKELKLSDRQLNLFNKINSSTERMSALINDVLEYSKLTGTSEGRIESDLNEVMEHIKTDFELIIQEKGIKIEQSKLPVVKGNQRQMHQLLSNLLSNAIKFSKQDPVISIDYAEISAEETAQHSFLNPSRSYYHIRFKDNGIGLEQKYAEQIFTIFQRLNDRQSYAGTGIGLAMCKKIVMNHEGAIRAEGVLNEGCTFHVYLPAN